MRRALLAAYAVYLAVAAYLVFWPQPDTPSGAVAGVVTALEGLGLAFIGAVAVEFLLNVALFVPLTLLGVVIWPRTNPVQWVATGVAATVLIEAVQYAVLPDRSATLSDLVANTLGALIGMDVGYRLRWWTRRVEPGPRGPRAPLAMLRTRP